MWRSNPVSGLHDCAKGKTAVVLANGPSVRDAALSELPDETILIGMNASILLCDSHDIAFDYYVFSDRRFFEIESKRKMAERVCRDVPCVVARADTLPPKYTQSVDTLHEVKVLGRDGFSEDLSLGYYFGATTTMLGIQLASYIGCERIVLAGVDLNYEASQPRFYEEDAPQIADSLVSVQLWNMANAQRELLSKGRQLLLASADSLARPYIPYVGLSELA